MSTLTLKDVFESEGTDETVKDVAKLMYTGYADDYIYKYIMLNHVGVSLENVRAIRYTLTMMCPAAPSPY